MEGSRDTNACEGYTPPRGGGRGVGRGEGKMRKMHPTATKAEVYPRTSAFSSNKNTNISMTRVPRAVRRKGTTDAASSRAAAEKSSRDGERARRRSRRPGTQHKLFVKDKNENETKTRTTLSHWYDKTARSVNTNHCKASLTQLNTQKILDTLNRPCCCRKERRTSTYTLGPIVTTLSVSGVKALASAGSSKSLTSLILSAVPGSRNADIAWRAVKKRRHQRFQSFTSA